MMLNLKQVALASVLIVSGLPVLAEDIALVIGNTNYRHQPNTQGAKQVVDAKAALEAAGFRVIFGEDQTKAELTNLASEFILAMPDADHAVVVLSGQVASSKRDSWLLASDGEAPNILSVGDVGLSLGALMDVMAQKPGKVIMAVGENGGSIHLGDWLVPFAGDFSAPRGVTLVRGPTSEVVQFLGQTALVRGKVMGDAPGNTVVSGYVSLFEPFLPKTESADTVTVKPADRAYWKAVRDIGTIEALMTYVERYPEGHFIDKANLAIEKLRANTPERRAKEGERRLELDRQSRRQIQRNLAILGFEPHGIDGLFGPNTRAAILAWQKSTGRDETGYLRGKQVTVLQRAADTRSLKLEKEARRRQQEQDRQDRIYWSKTGQDGTEASLRAYLKRYPDGIYSEIAHQQIVAFERMRRAKAAAAERKYWDQVQADGSANAYRLYLKQYPSGAFAPNANSKLAKLEERAQKVELIRRARNEEQRVASSIEARFFVERKLHDLGLKPGKVDGEFDDLTRRALRKFQRARQLPISGHVTQQTIVRLMAAR